MSIGTIRVIYCSTVTSELAKDSFMDLVRVSVINNKKSDLTGILLFDGKYFFQVLEGDSQAVSDLMDKISQDERHSEIKILSKREIHNRLFPKWSMELIDANNDFFAATYGGNFQPYGFNDVQALDCATNAKAWRMRRLNSKN